MSMTGLPVFDHTVHETNTWLHELMEELGPDKQRAYSALRATLHALRDRLTVEEATDLGAQLPMLVRGIYYEGWNPAKTPQKLRSREEFLAHIGDELRSARPMNTDQAARAVFKVLENHVTAGETSDIRSVLPGDIRALWPSESRPS